MPRVPTDAELDYMLAHIEDDKTTSMIVATAICVPLGASFVALRFACRKMSGIGFQANDWLVLGGWIFSATCSILFASAGKYGTGRHSPWASQYGDLRLLQIINICNEIIYCFAISFIKFAILSLYSTIFPQVGFRYCLMAVAAFISLWCLTGTITTIVQCLPISLNWDPTIPGHCINYGAVVLVIGILNIITDFVILAMPIPLVLKLDLTSQKKRLVIFTFAIGSSACIVGVVRTTYVLKINSTYDPAWDIVPAAIAAIVELMVAILAACIITYRPIWRKIRNRDVNSSGGARVSFQDPPFVNSKDSRKANALGGNNPKARGADGMNVTDQIQMTSFTSKKRGDWVRMEEDETNLFPGSAKESEKSRSTTSLPP